MRSFLRRLLGAQEPAAAPVAQAKPDLVEYGATGTPILGGFLRDAGEYNPTLEGLAAFRVYEQMRRSDGQVAATVMGMKLPIRSADWTVAAPEDATPVEDEAAEFVRECLFEELDLDAILDNALLMLDFGCSAHEDVWYVDGNRWRLKKCAARLPATFYRWLCEGDELAALEQMGWSGEEYKTAQVPANKLALFTWQQEGSNFAGRSVLRPMYQHWYIKSALYKIDAIANERNGMGVPFIKMGPDAKAEDKATAIGWLQQLSVHEKAALLLPNGWDWGLMGVSGTLRDPKESIAHHNMAISMAGLAQFMMLGQSESGNRALGQTMSDFFYLGLQATANRIARVINLTTVERLCRYNFGTGIRYPRLVAQQILSVQFDALVAALQQLANAGIVQADDDLESWVRNKIGAPEAGKPRVRPAAPPEAPESSPEEKTPLQATEGALRLSREPRGAEKYLALDEIVGELDRGRDAIAAALRRAKKAVQAEAVQRVMAAPLRTMHRVSIAPPEKLVAEVEEILAGVFGGGVEQVAGERARQKAGLEPGDAATVREMADWVPAKKRKRDPLGVYADGVVAEFVNQVTSRAVGVALDWLRRPGDLTKGELINRVTEELDAQSDKWIDGAASKGANEAFADGRQEGYEEYRDEIQAVIYSALLDFNTCPNCANADGAEGRTPEDIPGVPNPDCDGGDRCRCVHVFVFSDEVRK